MSDPLRPLLQQGLAFHREGKFDEAKKIYEQVLESNPRHTDALHFLGLVAHNTADYTLAEELIRKAINTNEVFFFYNSLGNALREQGKKDEAMESYERALALKPDFPDALNNLGAMHLSRKNVEKAEELYNRALSIDPNHVDTLVNLGNINAAQGHLEEAVKFYQRVVAIKPHHDALMSLGSIFYSQSQPYTALGYFQEAFKLCPDSKEALNNLAAVFSKLERYDDAIAFIQRALSIDPAYAPAYDNLGGVHKSLGDLDGAIEYYKKALELSGFDPSINNNLLLAMVYASSVSPEELAQTAREYGCRLENFLTNKNFSNDIDLARKLRIGYVSADFRSHSVNYFFEPLLAMHDKEKFEIYAYSNMGDDGDSVTERLKKEFDHWQDTYYLTDQKVYDLIQADQIDILIDLAGHTGGNRLKVFARKPAPVQLSWLGYPATTGLKNMDYRITDPYAEPEGLTEHLNTETLYRLPDIFCCYQPHKNSPAVIDHPPFEDNGYVTFGCFNNFSKVTDEVLKTWVEIMQQVPESRLLLEIAGIDRPVMLAQVKERLEKIGIPLERTILEKRTAANQFNLYNKIDMALDPFPCNGGTTSMDTLWMGVPFVTLEGRHFVSRMGVTILTNVGLGELIAKDTQEYIKIASDLAHDRGRLKKMRHGLRERAAASPLMDQERFTRNMESAYRDMWRIWCTQEAREPRVSDNHEEANELAIRGVTLKALGRVDEAVVHLKAALKLEPHQAGRYSELLLTALYSPSISPEEQTAIARQFGKFITDPLLKKHQYLNKREEGKKLRIGYVSPDFRNHAVSYFINPLLSKHDRQAYEIFIYSNSEQEDHITARLKSKVDNWHNIHSLDDNAAAELLMSHEIDILVDLAGHTAHNRLELFAQKPAPVQATWMGYPATTGMKAMNYRITDTYAEPEGMTEHLNAEILWRLPEIFCCYNPDENSPAVIDHLPFEDNDFITFGCLNNFAKVTENALNLWSKILHQVPKSRLLLEIMGIEHPDFQADLQSRFKNLDVPLERIIFEPRQDKNRYVLYNKIDIALDPFPCNGGTTSFDTLWMGVPFITLKGEHFVSRMGTTILSNAGLPELIARDTDEYVKIAVDLATDIDRLKKIRLGLREKVLASPLMDQERFVRNMEAAYRGMWKKWCEERNFSAQDFIKSGTDYFYKNDFKQARRSFEQALRLNPEHPHALVFLGMTLNSTSHFLEAVEVCQRALNRLDAASDQIRVLAWNTLGVAYKNLGMVDEAIKVLRRAAQYEFSRDLTYGNLLLTMVYAESITAEELAKTAREYGALIADPLIRKRPLLNSTEPKRKLKIGYVSPDFREHAVSYFTASLFENHSRDGFEIYAYSCGFYEDEVTQRFKKGVDHWHDIQKTSDDAAADLIERHQIDILVDLAGHTGQNRLPVFARKPAPVQVTWLGWPATTGMKAMDYRITDAHAEPIGTTEHLNIETLWRLPEIFCCYQPRANSPDVIEHPPLEDNGYITFGCFNNFAKVTDDTLVTWSKILSQVENSKLMLEITGLDDQKFRQDIQQRLQNIGLPVERVKLEPRKRANQFALYNKIDIALDPFPCVGGTTSFDTLWMGVPFVTLEGRHFVSRMGVSILTNADLRELIAIDADEYIKIAVDLANDRMRLKKLRHGLREKVAASPLMDQERFARNIETAYRAMWKKWCAEQ